MPDPATVAMYFSIEIWEQIFWFLDVVTLVKLKPVCKTWNALADRILKKSTAWHEKCKTDIPEEYWSSLCEKLSPEKTVNSYTPQDATLWMSMYRLWCKSKYSPHCEAGFECVEPLPEWQPLDRITCIVSSKELLAIGTFEGFVYFYNVKNFSTAVRVFDQLEHVKNIQLLRNDDDVLALIRDVNSRVSVVSPTTDGVIDEIWGNIICASCNNSCIVTDNYLLINGSRVIQTMITESNKTIVAGADNNKMFFYTEKGHYVKLMLPEMNITHKFIAPSNLTIRQYYAFQPEIIVGITEHGYLEFLVNGGEWKAHNVFPLLQGMPTAIFICAHLLVLGLNTGVIHLYHIEDFDNLDFYHETSRTIIFDATPVVAIDMIIREGEEYLMVAHPRKIYLSKYS